MPLVCSHCSRTNCADARYCYHDGASLLGSASPALAAFKTFLTPFVFPSGLVCKDFDAFIVGCDQHWDAAVEMLVEGTFQQFFKGMGRMDLAQIAREAANFPDRDRGLDQFLTRLPSTSLAAAKLAVQPKQINLGTVRMGQCPQLEITLENQGARLIFGSIASESPWLAVTETGEPKLFQFRDSTTIAFQVKGQQLRAGLKPLEGELTIESNAGTFTLRVVANVPVQAFPEGCLAGVRTPRELAEKAKASPTVAGALFASGAVAKWYNANGWTYPVQGPSSSGIAAVQQFFEALGLSKPPKVVLAQPQLVLKGAPGTTLTHKIVVRTDENRAVYAHAVSTVDWCVAKPGESQGNWMTVPVEVTVPTKAGQTVTTLLRVTSNGQQRFDVPVEVTADAIPTAVIAATVTAPAAPPPRTTPVPVAASAASTSTLASKTAPQAPAAAPEVVVAKQADAPRPALSTFDPLNLLMHLAPLVLLGFILLGLVAKDVYSDAPRTQVAINDGPTEVIKVPNAKIEFKVAIQDEPDEGVLVPIARYDVKDEPEERIGNPPPAPVKVEIKDEPAEMGPERPIGQGGVAVDPKLRISYAYGTGRQWGVTDTFTRKLLTYSGSGSTNRTMVRTGGRSRGLAPGGQFVNLPDDPAREARQRSSYSFNDSTAPGLRVTQILEIVPSKQPVDVGGQQRRLMDTLLVRYIFENTGKQAVNAGFRQEIDTLIGGNDGVPFTVPGRGLVNTSADFPSAKQVPDFVQALETGSLRNPGTIVHISLKVGGAIEAPSRVVLCHWASNGDLTNPVATNMGTDSAIIMVWPDQMLQPGKRREMGYAYGLGSVTVADPGGTMAVALDGNYDIGQSFTIIAYVNKPIAGQTVALDLPPGLERIKGEQTQRVPAPNVGDTSIVSWEAKVLQTGVFPVKVKSSTGITQTKTITIARGDAPTGGKLTLALDGPIAPGQVFTLTGKVNEPAENQALTLHLPAGLEKVAGPDTQSLPAPPAGSRDASVEWKVRVLEPGKYPVRVSSSTGIAQTKTITIAQPTRAEGAFQILVTGDIAPGKAFTVTTKVAAPVPNQTLTLVLPPGLQRVSGEETQSVEADAVLTWKVKVEQAGKYTVGVKSTTGVTQRKTVIIEPPGDQPGRFDVELAGDISPGKEFKVIARVTNPTRDQTLTLVLPKGLELTKGEALQRVEGTLPLAWTVRVTETGRLPVRVESSTGLVRTKTITLAEPSSTLFGR